MPALARVFRIITWPSKRLTRALRVNKAGAELLRCRELARLEQRHEVVKFFEGVLDGCGREQQQEMSRQRVDGLPGLRVPVAQIVRLIDDEHVPMHLPGDLQLRRLFQRVEAGHQARVLAPEFIRVPARLGVVGGNRREAELVAQFLLPLVHQRGHSEHEETLHHSARQQFLEHQAGLDGLAQPHFVGQQSAAAQGAQHAQGGAQLVLQPLQPAERQAKEVVRLVGDPPQCRAFPQRITSQVGQGESRLLKLQPR
jgi:hypothetical protein